MIKVGNEAKNPGQIYILFQKKENKSYYRKRNT